MAATQPLNEFDHDDRLGEVLDRVRHDERLTIKHQSVMIGVIVLPDGGERATFLELAIRLSALPPFDDDFEADIKDLSDNQLPLRVAERPDRSR